MEDAMFLSDGFAASLQCAHPDQKSGEPCSICGSLVPQQETEQHGNGKEPTG